MRDENGAVSGWKGRLFKAVCFLFLALFVAFVVLLIIADVLYIDPQSFLQALSTPKIMHAFWNSIWTSFLAVLVSLLFAVPVGYVMSRYRFPGHLLCDTVIDLPIIFPPVVAGLTLLVFFSQTGLGQWVQNDLGLQFVFQPKGIVLCQFLVSASFAIRAARIAFDEVDRRVEKVALTLGCTTFGAFRRVTLPLAARGIAAGAILVWARAFGLFGPLMIFVGSVRGRTEVLSSTVYLEQSVGRLDVALAVALLMIAVALVALTTIRVVGGKVTVYR